MNDVQTTNRVKVATIEQELLKHPQVDLPVEHYFSPGVYARELHIPKGTILTGRVHKFENMNILSKGEMSVMTDQGMRRVTAPFTVVSPPGTKRIAYAHEDCVWTTILGTEETDPEKIELEFTTNDEADYLAFRKTLNLEGK